LEPIEMVVSGLLCRDFTQDRQCKTMVVAIADGAGQTRWSAATQAGVLRVSIKGDGQGSEEGVSI
jgi:hypothetical protein